MITADDVPLSQAGDRLLSACQQSIARPQDEFLLVIGSPMAPRAASRRPLAGNRILLDCAHESFTPDLVR